MQNPAPFVRAGRGSPVALGGSDLRAGPMRAHLTCICRTVYLLQLRRSAARRRSSTRPAEPRRSRATRCRPAGSARPGRSPLACSPSALLLTALPPQLQLLVAARTRLCLVPSILCRQAQARTALTLACPLCCCSPEPASASVCARHVPARHSWGFTWPREGSAGPCQ